METEAQMRTILALILFASVAVGQERNVVVDTLPLPIWLSNPSKYMLKSTLPVSSWPQDVSTKALLREYGIIVFLELYSRYEKACADSSLRTTWVKQEGGTWVVTGRDYDHTPLEPTLRGFAKWLRKER